MQKAKCSAVNGLRLIEQGALIVFDSWVDSAVMDRRYRRGMPTNGGRRPPLQKGHAHERRSQTAATAGLRGERVSDSIRIMRLHHPNLFDLLFASIFVAAVYASAAELPTSRHPFVVIAHRGNHEHAHENTLAALQAAIAAGADYAEIDVRRTADGAYILMHDRTVNRMTDGHGAVKDLTLAQLKALHVRDPKRPSIPADQIPTFMDALRLIKGSLNIYLDFKEGDRAEVARMIREAGVIKQVLVYDGIEAVPEWHRVAPELPLIISAPEEAKTPGEIVSFATTNRIEVLDGSWEGYTKAIVDSASRSGVKVWPDIQAGREDGGYFEKVLERGFSGVQTDHPEELITWLKEHGRR